jgi:peptidoglycan/xylan/chitin deacetylase (PgdA/CDA1 family)
MTTRVLLTVDTELAWRHAAARGWEENYVRSVEPAGVGLGYQLELLARHGLKACFFIDPMPACRYGIDPVRRMVETVLAAGQEVQLHLHPSWMGGLDRQAFELTGLSLDRQQALIDRGARFLVEAGAPAPIAFRAGSFGADDSTLRALARLGFRYDSSFNASHAPWPCAISLPLHQIDPVSHCGVVELPVGQIAGRGGALRHFQLCALSQGELRHALRHAARAGQQVATLVSHSFELAARDGLRPNVLLKRRFERLCLWLAAERDRLPTVHFADLPDLRLDARSDPAEGNGWRSFGRMAEQAFGNLLYEGRF